MPVAGDHDLSGAGPIFTGPSLIRWSGLAAAGAGIVFAAIQPIHPPDVLAAVTTDTWTAVHYLGVTMCLLGLVGTAGLYARQVRDRMGSLDASRSRRATPVVSRAQGWPAPGVQFRGRGGTRTMHRSL